MVKTTLSAPDAGARTPTLWAGLALGSHLAWGAYPSLARFLQVQSGLPSLSLLAVGNIIALVCLLIALRPRFHRALLRLPTLWLFALVIVGRSVTNMLAARYTLAIYVQLITLLTPFLVALLSATLLQERLPVATGRALVLSLAGSLLMLSSDLQGHLGLALTGNDWLGIGLAFASSLCLALYMLLVRRSVSAMLSAETLFLVQLLAIIAVTLPLSFALGESWERWATIGTGDWLVFLAFVLVGLLGANLSQIVALRRLGAPFVSSLMAARLISALAVAAILLGEQLTSPWQAAGALLVLGTITWYLRQQAPAGLAKAHPHSVA